MRAHTFLKAFLLSSVAGVTIAGAGFAADVEEIVVTAQKRSENIQSVPMSIVAVSADTLATVGAGSADALEEVTPGLLWNHNSLTQAVFLRGIGSSTVTVGTEPSVAVYVDDQYQVRSNAQAASMPDVDRVEVLKGPQGTLFGRNATGGVVRIVTKDVTDELTGDLKITYGNFDTRNIEAVGNIPITDNFAIRIVGSSRDHKGYAKNLSRAIGVPDRVNNENTGEVRLKAKWTINDDVVWRFGVGAFSRDDFGGQSYQDLTPPGKLLPVAIGRTTRDPDFVYQSNNQPNKGETYNAYSRLEWDMGEVSFVSATNYQRSVLRYGTDADTSDVRLQDVTIYERSLTLSQDFQLLSSGEGPLTWLVGLYGWHENANISSVFDVGLPTILGPLGRQFVRTYAFAPYGQATYAFAENWALTVGARYSYEKKKVFFTNANVTNTIVAGAGYRASNSWKRFTPKATLEYKFNPDTLVYVTYASGFKSGGYNYSVVAGGVVQAPVKNEVLDMYEAGIKGRLADGRLRFDLSGFYYDYRNLQVQASTTINGVVQIVTNNAANAEVYGLDGSFDFAATDDLVVNAGFSWLARAKYTSYPAATARIFNPVTGFGTTAIPCTGLGTTPIAATGCPVGGLGPFNATGKDILNAPKFTATFGATYTFHAGEGTIPVSIAGQYKGRYFAAFIADAFSDLLHTKDGVFINARVAYMPPSEAWSIGLWGTNLTNHRIGFTALGTIGARANYTDPRTYGIDFTLHF